MPTKTVREREQELRALLATPSGRESGKPRPPGTSAVTYVLVHERSHGLIEG
jgi:hypothetical protein